MCEYDSTWDTESDGDEPAAESQSQSQSRRSSQDKNKSAWTLWHHTSRNMRAAKDMQNYRRGYPNLTDDECSEDKMNNLQFYLNKFPSAPDDIYIESFLKDWKNDYKRLERVHSYIQWLFPLREPGVNYMASELSKKEIEAFKKNEEAKRRLVESYELMLGFYGIRLVNKDTGEVKRAENWKERFGNLERNMHNNLRITRILKSLGELGFEHYQAPLVRFFLEETLVKKNLGSVKRSVLDYFLFAVLDKQNRQELLRFAFLHFEPKDKFVWCPRKIQKQLRRAEKRCDTVGNGDGKDEACSRGKGKDGEAAAPQGEDGSDDAAKTQKETDKTAGKEENAPSEATAEPERETVANGNAEVEFNSEVMGNGNDSADDGDEMDQSSSPDTAAVATRETGADAERKPPNGTADAVQEEDNRMQTDQDTNPEKPPKKKREEENEAPPPPSNGSAGGASEEKSRADKSTDPASAAAAAQTPLKTFKHSPTLSSGREEKIPRTEFNQVPDKTKEEEEEEEDMSQDVAATNGSVTSSDRPVDD